jgi:hypothetical protein
MTKCAPERFIIRFFFFDICPSLQVSMAAVTLYVDSIGITADAVTLRAPMPLDIFQFLVGEIIRGVPITGMAFIA